MKILMNKVKCVADRSYNKAEDMHLMASIKRRLDKGLKLLLPPTALKKLNEDPQFDYSVEDGRRRFTALTNLKLTEIELEHGVTRHGAENLTKMFIKNAFEVYVNNEVMKQINSKHYISGSLIKLGYGLGSKYSFTLPFSRVMEYEADKLGILFLARAGYDPQIAVDFLLFMKEKNKDMNWWEEYLSTHSLNKKRIKYAQLVVKKLNERK